MAFFTVSVVYLLHFTPLLLYLKAWTIFKSNIRVQLHFINILPILLSWQIFLIKISCKALFPLMKLCCLLYTIVVFFQSELGVSYQSIKFSIMIITGYYILELINSNYIVGSKCIICYQVMGHWCIEYSFNRTSIINFLFYMEELIYLIRN